MAVQSGGSPTNTHASNGAQSIINGFGDKVLTVDVNDPEQVNFALDMPGQEHRCGIFSADDAEAFAQAILEAVAFSRSIPA